jgi:hypothetical protein
MANYMNTPNYMNQTPDPTNYMNPTSDNAPSTDPDLDENRPLTPNPNENQYGEDMEFYNYLRSLMGKSPIPDPNLTSELKDTDPNYMNSPKFKIMVTEMANPNCFDVPESAYKNPDPQTVDAETYADPMNNVYQHDPELLNYLKAQISIPFVPASNLKDAANV